MRIDEFSVGVLLGWPLFDLNGFLPSHEIAPEHKMATTSTNDDDGYNNDDDNTLGRRSEEKMRPHFTLFTLL